MTEGPDGPLKAGGRAAVRAAASATAALLAGLIRRPWSAEAARAVLSRRGFHLLRHHYYLPIPEAADCDNRFFASSSELVGVELDEDSALALLESAIAPTLAEFRSTFPIHPDPQRPGFHLINGNYMAVDAHVYYGLIRHFAPRRIVEIGSGNSTLVAAAAVAANRRDGRRQADLIAIEPFPGPALRTGLDGAGRLVESKVQEVPLGLFEELEAGDILFIDSSHCLRSGGDVQYEYLEILPRLGPGVLVHIHDISLPRPYPRTYFERQLYWNEQYLLQAFLAFNSRFEVLWPGALMMERHPDRITTLFPEVLTMRQHYPDATPTAFWMRVRR